jgi:hypothetical protein
MAVVAMCFRDFSMEIAIANRPQMTAAMPNPVIPPKIMPGIYECIRKYDR